MAFLVIVLCSGFWSAVGRRSAAWCAIIAVLAVAGTEAIARTPISAENQIKAVFLFNFAQFLEWPPRVFPEPRTPIVIGVLGDDPFGPYLDGLVRGERIGERPMAVRRYHRVEDAEDCQILFISRSETSHLGEIIAQLKGRGVLTVGDADGFTRQGGMVRFATTNGKIQLRINVTAAKAADLTISARLLAHATIVPAGKE